MEAARELLDEARSIARISVWTQVGHVSAEDAMEALDTAARFVDRVAAILAEQPDA